MNVTEIRRMALTLTSRTYRYGPDDPRTIEIARKLAEAKAQAAEAEAARLRAIADDLAAAS